MPSSSSSNAHPSTPHSQRAHHTTTTSRSNRRKKRRRPRKEKIKEPITKNKKSRINYIARFILLHAHLLFAMTGFALIAFGIYILVTDWSVPTDFFRAAGIMVVLFGIILLMIAHMGLQGIGKQNDRYGVWTGRKVICSYHFILTALMGCELYLLGIALRTVQLFQAVRNSSTSTSTSMPSYPVYVGSEETIMANIFNELFFSAVHVCDVNNHIYGYLWKWVNNNCPATLSLSSCRACASYSITMCSADATACHADSGDSSNMACPYNTCRANILEYMSNRIYPVSYVVFALLCFQAVIFLLTTLIACYTPRDGIEEILAKSGLKVSSTMTESIRIASARLSSGNRDNSEYRELAVNDKSGADADYIDDGASDEEDIEEGITTEVEDHTHNHSATAEKTPNKSPIEKSLTYIASAIKSSFYSDKDEIVARSSSSDSVRYESIYTGNGLSDAPNLNLAHLELGQVKHHAHQHSHSSNSVEGSVNLTGPATTAATSNSTSPVDQKKHSVVRATSNLTSGLPAATTSTAARTSTSTSTSAVDQRFHSISRAGNLTPRSSSAAATTTSTSSVDHKYHPITDGGNLTSRGSTAATTAATSGRSFNAIPSQYERLQSLTTASTSTSHHHHYSKQEQRHHARSKNHDLL